MMDLRKSLDRTLLLMRDELRGDAPDEALLEALTCTEVALVADGETLASPAAQSAFITTALLCARSGHKVYLQAPDVALAGIQPPLTGKSMVRALLEIDGRIVPRRCFESRAPSGPVDLEIRLGASGSACASKGQLTITAAPWSTSLSSRNAATAWPRDLVWPLGAMAGAALVSAEAFKCAMRKLRNFARDVKLFDEFFRPIVDSTFALAPLGSSTPTDLGGFDLISGGAITNGMLYALSRIPNVRGVGRIIEPDIADTTNLNRYMLLLTDGVDQAKAPHLAGLKLGGLALKPLPWRFENESSLGSLAGRVLVGVDHIPTRWAVQRAQPRWLGIGATTHWSAMASFHVPGSPCAGCLHPRDDPAEGPIPTVAFVSFMAALLQITFFLRAIAGDAIEERQVYVTLPRPEVVWRSVITQHPACPVGHLQRTAA